MRPLISLLFVSLAALALLAVSAAGVSAQQVGEGERAGTKIIIRALQRDDGGTVTLRFQMVNEKEKPETLYNILGGYLDGRVHLIDAGNKKKYLIVKDSANKCECTQIRGEVSKDNPANLWAKFPAPPESVVKITVVVDGFEPVESVPITAR